MKDNHKKDKKDKKNQQYQGPYAERLVEIDKRIKNLNKHIDMWRGHGSIGGNMIMKAFDEIKELKEEKRRILDGTQEEIDKKTQELEYKINALKTLKSKCMAINFITKYKLNKEIDMYEKQKTRLKH